MKKIKRVLISLCLVFLLPLGLVLTACGATPSNEVRGVFFDSNYYDQETGYAIFEYDLGTTTKLAYKVNPSSWSGYIPEYQVIKAGENAENLSRFKLENGEVTITSSEFEDITIQISLNDFTDICIVKLKKYPNNIFLINDNGEKVTEDHIVVSANTIQKIHVFGMFGAETEPRELLENNYKFNVVSSNETIVHVFNPERLTIFTVKNRPERAVVSIELLNADGKSQYETTLKLTVDIIPPIDRGALLIDGYDSFIDGTEESIININVSADMLQERHGGEYYVLSYQAFAFTEAEAGTNPVYIDEEMVNFNMVIVSDNVNVSSPYGSREIEIASSQITREINLTFYFALNTAQITPFTLNVTIKLVSE